MGVFSFTPVREKVSSMIDIIFLLNRRCIYEAGEDDMTTHNEDDDDDDDDNDNMFDVLRCVGDCVCVCVRVRVN
jgi:hypothetical protein